MSGQNIRNEQNDQWVLARTPLEGWPADGDFRYQSVPVPEPRSGQCLTRTIYLSLDPYQWGRRRSGTEKPGDVCHGRTVSQVIASRKQPLLAAIPDEKCEHSPEVSDALIPVFLIEMKDDLCIAVSPKSVTKRLQTLAQRGIVINFAVADDPHTLVFIGDRLAPP